jgi:metal transporter CNNM
MVPVSLRSRHAGPYPLRAIYSLLPIASSQAMQLMRRATESEGEIPCKKEQEGFVPDAKHITFAVLIPVLVLLSGLFAGLTLGYMSLDETQLNVLSVSGTP